MVARNTENERRNIYIYTIMLCVCTHVHSSRFLGFFLNLHSFCVCVCLHECFHVHGYFYDTASNRIGTGMAKQNATASHRSYSFNTAACSCLAAHVCPSVRLHICSSAGSCSSWSSLSTFNYCCNSTDMQVFFVLFRFFESWRLTKQTRSTVLGRSYKLVS